MDIADTTYVATGDKYKIRAKYEQEIGTVYPEAEITADFFTRSSSTAEWKPLAGKHVVWSVSGSGTSGTQGWASRRLSVDPGMIATNGQQLTYTVQSSWTAHQSTYPYRYFVESLPGEPYQVSRSGICYALMDEYSQDLYSSTLSAKSIAGLTPQGTTPVRYAYDEDNDLWKAVSNGKYYCFFYKRLSYNLVFNGNRPDAATGQIVGLPGTRQVRYGANIGPAPEDPTLDKYVFEGWYRDAEFREAFEFGVPMPNAPRTVFAKWTSTEFTLTFFDRLGGTQVTERTSAAGEFIDFTDEQLFQPDEAVDGKGQFLGWTWYVGNIYTDFFPRTPIHDNYQLYATWKTDGFAIRYEAGDGSLGTHPGTDGTSYSYGDNAVLSDGSGLIPPPGKTFFGWLETVGDGKLHFAGETVEVKRDLAFTAVFAAPSELNELIYHANYPDDTDAEQVALIPDELTDSVLLAGALFTFGDWQLVGWAWDKDAGEADFELGESQVDIGDDDEVHLYAVWQRPSYSFTVEHFMEGAAKPFDRVVYEGVLAWQDITYVSASALLQPGYSRASETGLPFQVVDNSAVVQVYYSEDVYTIHYALGGGTNAIDNPETYSVTQMPLSIDDPDREGFDFAGWLSEELELAVPVAGLDIPDGTTGNITLTAQWTQVSIPPQFPPDAILRVIHTYTLDEKPKGSLDGGHVYAASGVPFDLGTLVRAEYGGQEYVHHGILVAESPDEATGTALKPGDHYTFAPGQYYVVKLDYSHTTPALPSTPGKVDPPPASKPDPGSDPKPKPDKPAVDPAPEKPSAGTKPGNDRQPPNEDSGLGGQDNGIREEDAGDFDHGGQGSQGGGQSDAPQGMQPDSTLGGETGGADGGAGTAGLPVETEGVPKPLDGVGYPAAMSRMLEAQTGNLAHDIRQGYIPVGTLYGKGMWGLLNLLLSLLAVILAVLELLILQRDRAQARARARLRSREGSSAHYDEDRHGYAATKVFSFAICAAGLLTLFVWLLLDPLDQPVAIINRNTLFVTPCFVMQAVLFGSHFVRSRTGKRA
jgi:uncharacterized repeat protein (TIGR02543 family)